MTIKEHLLRSASGIDHYLRQESDGSIHVESHQDVQDILDHNKAMATHNDGYTPSRDMRRVASIPMMLILKWKMEEGWDAFAPECAEKLRQKLNDPEFRHLRTAPGKF